MKRVIIRYSARKAPPIRSKEGIFRSISVPLFCLCRTQSQIGFLSFVVLDQFRALSDLVPGAEELVVQGEKNLEDWQAAMDILREAERRDA